MGLADEREAALSRVWSMNFAMSVFISDVYSVVSNAGHGLRIMRLSPCGLLSNAHVPQATPSGTAIPESLGQS